MWINQLVLIKTHEISPILKRDGWFLKKKNKLTAQNLMKTNRQNKKLKRDFKRVVLMIINLLKVLKSYRRASAANTQILCETLFVVGNKTCAVTGTT